VKDDKAGMRDAMRRQLASASSDGLKRMSERAQSVVLDLPELRIARLVFCYIAREREVQTDRIIAALLHAGQRVCVPGFDAARRAYMPVRLRVGEVMGLGPLGIPQPAVLDAAAAADIDVAVVPGVAFDPDGGRLGHGAGHYDRMLSRDAARAYRIGVAFAFQIVPRIPMEPWDVRMNAVATEDGVRRCGT
jgi:5-formyltetrahydrofolate cyclo-ligase